MSRLVQVLLPVFLVLAVSCAAIPMSFQHVDTTVDPCDDFYLYACGAWINKTVLPPSLPMIDKAFYEIGQNNRKVLLDILENHDYPLISTFYKDCMDQDAIDKLGIAPLIKYWKGIIISNSKDLLSATGFLHSFGSGSLFSFSSAPDAKNPLLNIANLDQAGAFALPDRQMYLGTDKSSKTLREQYTQHIVNMFTLFNDALGSTYSGFAIKSPQDAAEKILAFETELASISLPLDKIRDPLSLIHNWTLDEVKKNLPNIPFEAYLTAVKAPSIDSVNVNEPAFFTALDSTLKKTDISSLQVYLQWRLLHGAASVLPSSFVNETFNFFGKVLEGESAQQDRKDTCIAATDATLGDILGKYYVEQKFSGKSKTLALQMVTGIMNAFQSVVTNLKWMDADTKAAAIKKLHMVTKRVGYPDTWSNYTGYSPIAGEYLESTFTSANFEFRRAIDSINKPVDRSAWEMTADTINAYYEPTSNSINFPAGIMQNPYFDASFDPSQNYGGMGMIMGHELTHGFDDQGRMYDGNGAISNWWSNSSASHFEASTACMAKQYSAYEILPGVFVNGNLTLGENIADNGGIQNAFIAYKTLVGDAVGHQESKVVPGLTNYQVFFLSYAQGWCSKAKPEILKLRVETDVHSPPKFRVIGPLSNFDPFAQVYNCPVGSTMNPTTKCRVW